MPFVFFLTLGVADDQPGLRNAAFSSLVCIVTLKFVSLIFKMMRPRFVERLINLFKETASVRT